MSEFIQVPLSKTELQRILAWYDVYQNETQTTLVDVGLSDSLKYHLKEMES